MSTVQIVGVDPSGVRSLDIAKASSFHFVWKRGSLDETPAEIEEARQRLFDVEVRTSKGYLVVRPS